MVRPRHITSHPSIHSFIYQIFIFFIFISFSIFLCPLSFIFSFRSSLYPRCLWLCHTYSYIHTFFYNCSPPIYIFLYLFMFILTASLHVPTLSLSFLHTLSISPLLSFFIYLFSALLMCVLACRKKIPEHCRKKRNCQMSVVVLSVVITLATSAAPFVDWYAM